MNRKMQRLKVYINKLESVLVAFSGGVDSTFLLKVCKDVLGKDKVLAATIKSNLIPESELKEARELAELIGVKHIIVEFDVLNIPEIYENTSKRCYYCKKEIFSKLVLSAKELNLNYVVDGSNFDDIGDFRPGLKALKELGIKSPLKESKITKDLIRSFSKKMDLPTWNKPSMACLASRFPYNENITLQKLIRVEKAEKTLKKLGFLQFRVRSHENLARIEILSKEINQIFDGNLREEIVKKFEKIGFTYTTLDLKGYRSGSMNEEFSKGQTKY